MSDRLAYLAGFFDADGSMKIVRQTGANRGVRSLYLRLRIAQVCREPLDLFCEEFGGKVYGPYKSGGENANLAYIWVKEGSSAIGVLRSLQPWLVVKAERANIVLDAEDAFSSMANLPEHQRDLMHQAREAVREAISALNVRGRAKQIV